MQRPLAVAQPALYFGLKEPARKYGDTVAPGCGYMRGPFVFRRRLAEGERIVAVGGRHAGRYGVIVTVAPSSISALEADALRAAYTARFDDDAPDADDTTLLPHEVRRIPPDGDEVRRVAFEHLEAAAPSAALATSGRREWTAEEVSVLGSTRGTDLQVRPIYSFVCSSLLLFAYHNSFVCPSFCVWTSRRSSTASRAARSKARRASRSCSPTATGAASCTGRRTTASRPPSSRASSAAATTKRSTRR